MGDRLTLSPVAWNHWQEYEAAGLPPLELLSNFCCCWTLEAIGFWPFLWSKLIALLELVKVWRTFHGKISEYCWWKTWQLIEGVEKGSFPPLLGRDLMAKVGKGREVWRLPVPRFPGCQAVFCWIWSVKVFQKPTGWPDMNGMWLINLSSESQIRKSANVFWVFCGWNSGGTHKKRWKK